MRCQHARVLALALALSSSLAWGVADFVAGLKSRSLPVASVMLVAVVTGLALAGAVVLARGVAAPATSFIVYAALSAVVGSVGLAAFYRGLAVGAMSVVAPIAGTGAAVPVAFGLASGERPEAVQVVGAATAIVGARGAPLAVLAAVGLGSFLVAIDAASEGDVGWAILVNRLVSLGLVALAALLLRPRPPADLRDAAPAILVGALDTTANILIAFATTLGLISLVGVLGSLYPVVTITLARLVLGERIGRGQQVGAGTALAGVVLIAAG
jgi:drug/metabolite transporter (DMT)-like permease